VGRGVGATAGVAATPPLPPPSSTPQLDAAEAQAALADFQDIFGGSDDDDAGGGEGGDGAPTASAAPALGGAAAPGCASTCKAVDSVA